MTKETKKMVKTAAFVEFREGGEIRTAQQELDNAAALAKANAPTA